MEKPPQHIKEPCQPPFRLSHRRAIDVILDQVIIYGGQPMTRRAVLAEMQAEGLDRRCIDFFVYGTPALHNTELSDDQGSSYIG